MHAHGTFVQTRLRLRPSSILLLLSIGGCSTWTASESPNGTPQLPRPQMSRDSVGIQIATVTLNHNQGRQLQETMRELDEQVMAVDQRRRLAANGIRAGTLDTQLPSAIRLLLLEATHRREHPTAETYNRSQDQQRFIQCRSEKRYVVRLWDPLDTLEIDHFDGDTTLRESFEDASGQMAVRCTPLGSRGATVRLTPEVEHGKVRQKFVPSGGAFHLVARREHEAYADLTSELTLRPGETALITCSEATHGLGQSLFRNADSTQQKILLVRLAQTQLDEMFGEEPDSSRLATIEN